MLSSWFTKCAISSSYIIKNAPFKWNRWPKHVHVFDLYSISFSDVSETLADSTLFIWSILSIHPFKTISKTGSPCNMINYASYAIDSYSNFFTLLGLQNIFIFQWINWHIITKLYCLAGRVVHYISALDNRSTSFNRNIISLIIALINRNIVKSMYHTRILGIHKVKAC